MNTAIIGEGTAAVRMVNCHQCVNCRATNTWFNPITKFVCTHYAVHEVNKVDAPYWYKSPILGDANHANRIQLDIPDWCPLKEK